MVLHRPVELAGILGNWPGARRAVVDMLVVEHVEQSSPIEVPLVPLSLAGTLQKPTPNRHQIYNSRFSESIR